MIECKMGEIITSQLKLMKRWSWSKAKLLNYQKTLVNDNMIIVVSDSKKTTIKILKYEDYQHVILGEEKRPQSERKKDRQKDQRKTKEKTGDNPCNNEDNQDVTEEELNNKTSELLEKRPEKSRKKDRKLNTTKQENKEDKSNIEMTWQNDFLIYQKQCFDAFTKLANDSAFIKDRNKFLSNVDIVKTMWNAYELYWSGEEAWKRFKKRKTKNINWTLVIKNAINWKSNRIYIPGSFNNKPESEKVTRLTF
jgi:hypothetical protein